VLVVNADQVKAWMKGDKKVLPVDARTQEEYLQGHIPGAINIMPDNMKAEAKRLPRDKATPLIFYCRGIS